MDDELWSTDRQTEALRTLRVDGRTVWSDSAAHEVSSRYLDPHDDLARDVIRASRDQSDALVLARREQLEAEACAQVALARATDTNASLFELNERSRRCETACAESEDAAGRAFAAVALARDEVQHAQQILAAAR